jgi:hypothetical protein
MTNLLKGGPAINAAIAAVATLGKKWEADVQHIAVSVIAHIEDCGDVTVADTLVAALPKGARSSALKAYLETFSKAVWQEAAPKTKTPAKFIHDKTKVTDMDGALKTTWAAFKPEPPYKPMDLCDLLSKMLARVEKDTKTEYDPELVAGIRALAAKPPMVIAH